MDDEMKNAVAGNNEAGTNAERSNADQAGIKEQTGKASQPATSGFVDPTFSSSTVGTGLMPFFISRSRVSSISACFCASSLFVPNV